MTRRAASLSCTTARAPRCWRTSTARRAGWLPRSSTEPAPHALRRLRAYLWAMALLMVFAAIAGAGTALSPCVLPILPAVLSAGASGGRRRPLGVVLGLALSFAFAVAGLAELLARVGLGEDTLRALAVLFLLAFGLLLIVPAAAARVEGALSGL